jgi:hypothetical protein
VNWLVFFVGWFVWLGLLETKETWASVARNCTGWLEAHLEPSSHQDNESKKITNAARVQELMMKSLYWIQGHQTCCQREIGIVMIRLYCFES